MSQRSGPNSELTVLNRGTIVTGDGSTAITDGALVMAGGRITGVLTDPVDPEAEAYETATVVDVGKSVVLPGLINSHMHQAFQTPFTAAAAPAPSAETCRAERDRHLLGGCTTVVNTDSFALPSERDGAAASHPLKVEFGACPTPETKKAATQSGGELSAEHRKLTVTDVVEAGAVVLGEVGSKNTLTGGIQRERYIPELFADRFGVDVTPADVQRLVEATVGRHADPEQYDEAALRDVLDDLGLGQALDPEDCESIVVENIMPSVRSTRAGFEEVGEFAAAYGVPMLVHTAASTEAVTRRLAARDLELVAGHVNHPSFTDEESVALAEDLQAAGATVEASSWDLFGDRTRDGVPVADLRERFVDLVERDLVDIVSTDYANGYWHGLVRTVEALVERDVRSLPGAVALATGNAATALPSVGATRGTLEPGKAADVLVVSADDLTEVERMFVDGEQVVRDGVRC